MLVTPIIATQEQHSKTTISKENEERKREREKKLRTKKTGNSGERVR